MGQTCSFTHHPPCFPPPPPQFFAQGDSELEAGLPVSPLMDRHKEGVTRAQPGVSSAVGRGEGRVQRWAECTSGPVLNSMVFTCTLWCHYSIAPRFSACSLPCFPPSPHVVLHHRGASHVPVLLLRLPRLQAHARGGQGQLHPVSVLGGEVGQECICGAAQHQQWRICLFIMQMRNFTTTAQSRPCMGYVFHLQTEITQVYFHWSHGSCMCPSGNYHAPRPPIGC